VLTTFRVFKNTQVTSHSSSLFFSLDLRYAATLCEAFLPLGAQFICVSSRTRVVAYSVAGLPLSFTQTMVYFPLACAIIGFRCFDARLITHAIDQLCKHARNRELACGADLLGASVRATIVCLHSLRGATLSRTSALHRGRRRARTLLYDNNVSLLGRLRGAARALLLSAAIKSLLRRARLPVHPCCLTTVSGVQSARRRTADVTVVLEVSVASLQSRVQLCCESTVSGVQSARRRIAGGTLGEDCVD
jgi:hypothetical protein